MSGEPTRVIQADDHGVTIELAPVHDGKDFVSMNFGEVRFLENGWIECRDPSEEEGRSNFFPPGRVLNIFKYDEDTDHVTSMSTSRR